MKLVKYLKEKSIDIALIQEHNIKSKEKIEYLLQFYTVILNKTILSNKQKQEYTYYFLISKIISHTQLSSQTIYYSFESVILKYFLLNN